MQPNRMNSLSRYYIDQEFVEKSKVTLTGEEAHHAARVRRVEVGQHIELFNGRGGSAIVKVEEVTKNMLSGSVESSSEQGNASIQVELCQAIPKGGNMEWIIQKAVELGVSSIQPLITEQTVARAEQRDKKLQKWQKVALEACKQCGQNKLPVIHPVRQFTDWLGEREKQGVEIVAALDPQSQPIHEVMKGKLEGARSVRLLVGPEGDFSKSEYTAMKVEQMHFVSLGRIVLKVETATIFCLSAIKYESNE